jgi:predicted metalloprotease with PDZ domain
MDPLGQNQDATDPDFHLNPTAWALILDRQWKGGDEGLVYVKRLSRLGTLYYTKGAPISPESIQDIAQALPALHIQERGNACLGVSCDPSLQGCMIRVVQPHSAAEQAGLEPADIIMRFDGEATRTFQELIEHLKGRDPGEKVKLDVLRNGREITKDVILGEWK